MQSAGTDTPSTSTTPSTTTPREIESHNPSIDVALRTFRQLSEKISPDRVQWRYDPIVLSNQTPVEYHLRQFEKLAKLLEGHTRRCYTSFAVWYGKTSRNLVSIDGVGKFGFYDPERQQRLELAKQMRDIAAASGIRLFSCCEDALQGAGLEKARCIDPELFHDDRTSVVKRSPTRKECGCAKSYDIGAYDSCLFGCADCYATRSRSAAEARRETHAPADTILIRPASRNCQASHVSAAAE